MESLLGRLKASLQRVQRLTQGFTDGLLALFPERANVLGAALGIQAERIQVKMCSPSLPVKSYCCSCHAVRFSLEL